MIKVINVDTTETTGVSLKVKGSEDYITIPLFNRTNPYDYLQNLAELLQVAFLQDNAKEIYKNGAFLYLIDNVDHTRIGMGVTERELEV